jgi:hypothetical protein
VAYTWATAKSTKVENFILQKIEFCLVKNLFEFLAFYTRTSADVTVETASKISTNKRRSANEKKIGQLRTIELPPFCL